MIFSEIVRRLEEHGCQPQKNGVGWKAKCPAHQDKTPSLSISEGNDGATLVRCFAGCSTESVCQSLGLRLGDLFAEKKTNSRQGTPPPKAHTLLFDWQKCVDAFTPEHAAKVADWRGYSKAFVEWLRGQGLIGSFNGDIAFPVHKGSRVVGCHCRLESGRWIYEPKGIATAPLVIGDAHRAEQALVFESQWDALAVMDRMLWYQSPPSSTAIVVTRGAGNGKLVAGLFEPGAVVHAFQQNDPPRADGKPSPAEGWLADMAAHAGCKVFNVATPAPHKDANDWTRAGATADKIWAAIGSEKLVNGKAEVAMSKVKDVATLLDERRFNPAIVPPPLRPIYTLAGHPICTPGNLTSITSAAKTGKSAVIGAMLASALTLENEGDFLGFHSNNPERKALLHFDTEQSPDDHWHQITRALKRAGLDAPPAYFHSYCLTGLGAIRACECVQHAIGIASEAHGGIHSVLIDGIADLVIDVNDPAEANAFVARLHATAIKNDCPIIGVIHFNPGSEKTRGHLGSQLERKSETNLRLDKDGEVTSIWSDRQRRAPIPKGTGPSFQWSDQAGMHVSVESRKDTAEMSKLEALRNLAEDVFSDRPSMRYSEIKTAISTVMSVSERTAERKLEAMTKLGVIKKYGAGLWIRNTYEDVPSTVKPPTKLPS